MLVTRGKGTFGHWRGKRSGNSDGMGATASFLLALGFLSACLFRLHWALTTFLSRKSLIFFTFLFPSHQKFGFCLNLPGFRFLCGSPLRASLFPKMGLAFGGSYTLAWGLFVLLVAGGSRVSFWALSGRNDSYAPRVRFHSQCNQSA
jgi:hypothetical protein